jgi:hypothetical protein
VTGSVEEAGERLVAASALGGGWVAELFFSRDGCLHAFFVSVHSRVVKVLCFDTDS